MYRIAIVDDNETWCFVLALRLQQQGYSVATFMDGPTFLRETDPFDLVLVDFSMPAPRYRPSLDGPELICRIKHQMDQPPLLILISSFFTEDLLQQATDLCPEADLVLSKQTESTILINQIEQLLASRYQSNRTNQSTQPSHPRTTSNMHH